MKVVPILHLWLFLLTASSLSLCVWSMAIKGDTAVVGVGVLGKHLCRMILEQSSLAPSSTAATAAEPSSSSSGGGGGGVRVLGVTKTRNNHEAILKDIGVDAATVDNDRPTFQLITSDDVKASCAKRSFDNVVFCAPPSGFDDYPLAVQTAIDQLWAGPARGVFVFTSSGPCKEKGIVHSAVGRLLFYYVFLSRSLFQISKQRFFILLVSYDPTAGGVVTEASKINEVTSDTSPRVARLVNAERSCLDAGGCCLRLAGLYDLQRGAHNFWLTSNSAKVIPSSPDGIINLLHYEDAAGACLAALRAGPRVCQSKTFLISDGHPMSRYTICQSALKAKVYQQGFVMPSFAGDEQPWALGKIYDGSVSNKLLNWNPRYESFDAFMEANA